MDVINSYTVDSGDVFEVELLKLYLHLNLIIQEILLIISLTSMY